MLLREMALPKPKRGNNLFKSSVLSVGLMLRPGVESSLLLRKPVQKPFRQWFSDCHDRPFGNVSWELTNANPKPHPAYWICNSVGEASTLCLNKPSRWCQHTSSNREPQVESLQVKTNPGSSRRANQHNVVKKQDLKIFPWQVEKTGHCFWEGCVEERCSQREEPSLLAQARLWRGESWKEFPGGRGRPEN